MIESEKQIITLAHEWIDAVGQKDRLALERILAPDFVIAGWLPSGKLADREFYIEDCLKPVALEQATAEYEEWRFRFYENIAVVNCIFRCHALVAGNEWGGVFLFTDVWIQRDERWQVVSRHSSPIS
jgi:hypothetical protein